MFLFKPSRILGFPYTNVTHTHTQSSRHIIRSQFMVQYILYCVSYFSNTTMSITALFIFVLKKQFKKPKPII